MRRNEGKSFVTNAISIHLCVSNNNLGSRLDLHCCGWSSTQPRSVSAERDCAESQSQQHDISERSRTRAKHRAGIVSKFLLVTDGLYCLACSDSGEP